jgi:hypothetical protein
VVVAISRHALARDFSPWLSSNFGGKEAELHGLNSYPSVFGVTARR